MAPSGKGGKGGKAIKEENEKIKVGQKKAEIEKKEADNWKEGSKSKDNSKEEKRLADIARKQEAARLLAAEELSNKKVVKAKAPYVPQPKIVKKVEKVEKKVVEKKDDKAVEGEVGEVAAAPEPVDPYTSSLDNELENMQISHSMVTPGQKAQSVEIHPERRFKAALEHFQETELPRIKQEYPGLRLQQYKERLFKEFQKHHDNPFNQLNASYNTTREGKIEAYNALQAEKEARLRGDIV